MITRDGLEGAADRGTPLKLEPLPIALLDEPIEYMLADHFRNRCVLAALRRFGETGIASRGEADMVAAYLDHDLYLHHCDEDENLFPALRKRAQASDNLGSVLARLSEDHRQSVPTIERIVAVLCGRPAEDPVRLDRSTRELVLAYARTEQRHLAIENGIVLVIARRRLPGNDLKAIGHAMKMRRGAIS